MVGSRSGYPSEGFGLVSRMVIPSTSRLDAEDGKTWTQLVDHAEWRKRSGHSLVAFQDHLWLLAGEDSPIGAMDEMKW